MPQVELHRFAKVDYETAWRWQTETASRIRQGGPEALFLLQHDPVYTFGRRVRPEHLLISREDLLDRGAAVVESDRGGDITFHGPGQIVAYPILNLRQRHLGPNDYVCALEETIIQTLAAFGIEGERLPGRPGVWTGNTKVAAVGVRVQEGVSLHGFALNVETDLSWFSAIVPCGISNAGVTSMERLLGRSPGVTAVESALIDAFSGVFNIELSEPTITREAVALHGR